MAVLSKDHKGKPCPPPGSDGEDHNHSDEDSDQGDISDDDDGDTESEDEQDPIIPLPDPAHEERMRILREENETLFRIVAEQDVVLAEMAARTAEIQEATQ